MAEDRFLDVVRRGLRMEKSTRANTWRESRNAGHGNLGVDGA